MKVGILSPAQTTIGGRRVGGGVWLSCPGTAGACKEAPRGDKCLLLYKLRVKLNRITYHKLWRGRKISVRERSPHHSCVVKRTKSNQPTGLASPIQHMLNTRAAYRSIPRRTYESRDQCKAISGPRWHQSVIALTRDQSRIFKVRRLQPSRRKYA